LKKNDSTNNRQFKLNYKKISVIGIVIIISIGITVFFGLRNVQSEMKMDPIIMHIHPKLNITMDNKIILVPSQIGIDTSLWKNHSLDKYGMQEMPGMSGMAPLHTHDNTGIIHDESSVNRNYTLGDFFNIWGMDLNGKIVNATVNGKPIPDFKSHVLKDNEQINLNITSKK
jgi:hypothetical protein